MDVVVRPCHSRMAGEIAVPSDKSMSHRAVLFAAMAEGVSYPSGVLDSADVRATISAVSSLGAIVRVRQQRREGLFLEVTGWGARGPRSPGAPVDCGNSGTTARLLMGALAGWPVDVTLTGDASLSSRPMRRVTEPLAAMGAAFETAEGGTLPVRVLGSRLSPRTYASPVASAQVKSAVLLAGLRAEGITTVVEPALSRDHTERMLPAYGVPVVSAVAPPTVSVAGPAILHPCEFHVPGDPSSAAFFAVAAAIVEGSTLELTGVSGNPTRTGFVRVLERMGLRVTRWKRPDIGAEPVVSLGVSHHRSLRSTTVIAAEVPAMIDEIPVLALAATQASGTTRFEGVGELRVKESDRLEAVRAGLTALGARVEAGDDWLSVTGPTPLTGTRLASLGDHRLAMTWAVAGLIAEGETVVEGFEAVDVSYPWFAEDLGAIGCSIEDA